METKSPKEQFKVFFSARRAYSVAESSNRINKPYAHAIRTPEEHFDVDDKVYYKMNNEKRWRGPAKVITQDHNVVFIRHENQILRIPTCRLVKVEDSRRTDLGKYESL